MTKVERLIFEDGWSTGKEEGRTEGRTGRSGRMGAARAAALDKAYTLLLKYYFSAQNCHRTVQKRMDIFQWVPVEDCKICRLSDSDGAVGILYT